jgi:hypothetical protein
MSGELFDRCNLNSTRLVRPFSEHVRILTQLCHLREISLVSGLSQFGVFIPVWPVWWTDLLWQLQRLVFSDSYKRHSTPLSWFAGSWSFAYSFNSLLSSPQPLFVKSNSFVEDSSVGWRDLCVSHLSSSLKHFGLRQASVNHLLLVGVKPPSRLGVALELASVWWVLESLWRSASPPKEKNQVSGSGKVVERDSAWSWPCEQLKLSQRRRRNHKLVILNFGKQILVSLMLYLLLYLLVLLCFHSISCDVLYCLSRYCVYLSLCLSRSTTHIFCELDCMSCYNSLSLY